MAKKTARSKPKAAPAAIPAAAEPAPIAPTPVAEPAPVQPVHKHGHNLYLGAWAYIVGLVVAFIATFIQPLGLNKYTVIVLAVFGVIVGLMNITDEEVLLFLVASLAFIVSASSVRLVLSNLEFVPTLMDGIIVFTAAGAFVVSFKALFKVAKTE